MDHILRLAFSIVFAVIMSVTMTGCGTSTTPEQTNAVKPAIDEGDAVARKNTLVCEVDDAQCCHVWISGSVEADFSCLGGFKDGEIARMNGGKYTFAMFHGGGDGHVSTGIVFKTEPKVGRHEFKGRESGDFLLFGNERGLYRAKALTAEFEAVGQRMETGVTYGGFRLKGTLTGELSLVDDLGGQSEGRLGEKLKVTFSFDFKPE